MTIKIGTNVRVHRLGISVCIIIFILLYFYAIRESSYITVKSEKHDNFVSLTSLLKSSIKAAEIGGMEIVNVHTNSKIGIEIKGKTKEGIDDPVTLADYKSHCAMYNYLSKTFPSVTVISEEKSKNCDDNASTSDLFSADEDSKISKQDIDSYQDDAINAEDITVWIDPLDATKEFTENLLNYVTTMVCVAVKGIPTIGIIHKPFGHRETWWAWSKHGASKNLAADKINKNINRKQTVPVLIVSRSHAGRIHNASRSAIGENVEIVSAAGAGYKSLEVVAGNATAYVHMTAIKKWDVCAGAAIINALGGTMSSLSGEPMIDFGSTDSMILEHGLLATMKDHKWYLDRFSMI